MTRFANPQLFVRLANLLLPWLMGLTVISFAVGIYLSFFFAPADYQQGETVRIMFVHVPSASMSMMVYGFMAACSAAGLIWRHQVADLVARAAAPVGATFTALALISGAFWGQPMWGTWWVWDARLTSELVLLFIYLGYMALWTAMDDPQKAARAAAILCLVGVVNLPIIKFSVDWWNTLHQPASLLKSDGPSIHGDMLWALFIMWAGFIFYFLTVTLIGAKGLIAGRRTQAILLREGG